LLTTCFLSLRRYLRQKKLEMPTAMTGAWLTLGGTLIALLLLFGALVPRPWPEYPWLNFTPFRSGDDNRASEWSQKGDAAAKDRGPGGKDGDPKDAQGGDGRKDRGPGEKDKDRAGGDGKDGKDGGAKKDQKDGKDGGQRDKDGGKDRDDRKDQDGKKERGDRNGGNRSSERQGDGSRSPSSDPWAWMGALRPLMKWIVWILLGLVVLLVLLRAGLGWMANFSDWARRLLEMFNAWWARLFGWDKQQEEADADEEQEQVLARPFAAFADPYESGDAARWPARQLVAYTFAALEAWARERGLARQVGETALEFSERLGNEVPTLEADLRRLAALVARAAYAPGAMPATTAETLRPLWQQLRRAVAA
jgi:hypothetical protein